MPQIIPPDTGRVESRPLQAWHNVFKPHWELLIALGYVDGVSPGGLSQTIEGLTAADGEVPFMGGDTGVTLTATPDPFSVGTTMYVVSNNAADIGMVIRVDGVDTNGDLLQETAVLNGTTPVQVGATEAWEHVNRSTIIVGSPAGDVFVSDKSTAGTPSNNAGDYVAVVHQDGTLNSSNARIIVPNGEILVFPQANFSCSQADGIIVRNYITKVIPGLGTFEFKGGTWYIYQTAFQVSFPLPIVLKAGEAILWTVERAAANNVNAALNSQYYKMNEFADIDDNETGIKSIFFV